MKNIRPTARSKVRGPEYVTRSVEVKGLVIHPRSFTTDEIRALPPARAEGFCLLCGSGCVKDSPRVIEGAFLRDVLDAADVLLMDHEAANRIYIVATGTDGYFSLFTWHEIFNSPAGEKIIVAYAKDGSPLGEDEGELCLVAAGDERAGPRRVRYLKTLDVRELEG